MSDENNYTNGDMPLGLGMAFAQNVKAMNSFSAMSKEEQQEVINKAHTVRSKQEMQAFVKSIENQSTM